MSLPPAARDSAPEVAIFQVDKSVSGATHQEGNEEKGRGVLGAAWRRVSLVLQSVLPTQAAERGPCRCGEGKRRKEMGGRGREVGVFRDAAGWRDVNWTNGEVCEEFRTFQGYWAFWLLYVSHFLTGSLSDSFSLRAPALNW